MKCIECKDSFNSILICPNTLVLPGTRLWVQYIQHTVQGEGVVIDSFIPALVMAVAAHDGDV